MMYIITLDATALLRRISLYITHGTSLEVIHTNHITAKGTEGIILHWQQGHAGTKRAPSNRATKKKDIFKYMSIYFMIHSMLSKTLT